MNRTVAGSGDEPLYGVNDVSALTKEMVEAAYNAINAIEDAKGKFPDSQAASYMQKGIAFYLGYMSLMNRADEDQDISVGAIVEAGIQAMEAVES